MRLFRLPRALRVRLARRYQPIVAAEQPDRDIRRSDGNRYLFRWYVSRAQHRRHRRGERPALYLHAFFGSDVDAALHDHPWPSASLIVSGSYLEYVPLDPDRPAGPVRAIRRRAGDVTVRGARSPHRIEIPEHEPLPVITLFATGFRLRDWGFWCAKGWRDARTFNQRAEAGGYPGAGCE